MWPFSTIKRLTAERDQARAYTEALNTSYAEYREKTSVLVETGNAIIRELQAKLKQAHFRNPKTGRLGVKGQTFD